MGQLRAVQCRFNQRRGVGVGDTRWGAKREARLQASGASGWTPHRSTHPLPHSP